MEDCDQRTRYLVAIIDLLLSGYPDGFAFSDVQLLEAAGRNPKIEVTKPLVGYTQLRRPRFIGMGS
jgi:hypothetical protein